MYSGYMACRGSGDTNPRHSHTQPTPLPTHTLEQEALEEMSSIDEEGGVTVRRDGDGKLERWQYGYR